MELPDGVLDGFTGVVSAHHGDEVLGEWAVGLADRVHSVPNTPLTRFSIASGSKTFTAAAVLSLVADGSLTLETRARTILGSDLPLIADDVTIDHLLSHRSGIGDYLDEDEDEFAPLALPVQALDSTPAFLPILDGYPTKFPAGERFSYCNGGYVVLALLAERVSGVPYAQLVTQRVFDPAGMAHSGFPRSDALPPNTATGYKDDGRSNIFDLPVVASGDGGAYTTAADVQRFWRALTAGAVLPPELVDAMREPVSPDADEGRGYGRGLWLDDGMLSLSGSDYGTTARSLHDVGTGVTVTALANAELPILARTNALMAAALEHVGGRA
ncbi:serine hydrolase domain-containing protein [Microbacterium sp. DT81.1]|uniref:serine hydrolase domain-containing protein n=1 Tax=Microbacterium sp. DT81.1 TaxID=3393413 RepID=UPI003CF6B0E8